MAKNVKFNRGDLKFLSMLLRGHELEYRPLKFDAGCWTDVDALLDHFNQCRERRWGIRQLLRAAKADKKGRIRLQGIDIQMREAIGQPLFPVRIRISQGHNKKLVRGRSHTSLTSLPAAVWLTGPAIHVT